MTAAEEACNLSNVLRGMVECPAPADLWERTQPDGDPYVARAADLLVEQAREIQALRPYADLYRVLRAQHWNDGTLAVMRSADLPLGVQTYSGALLDEAIAAIVQQGKAPQ